MKSISNILLVAATASLFSCSDNDSNSPDIPQDTSKITFAVSVPKLPRATSKPVSIDNFRTWGFVDGKTYMENVEVTQQDNGSWQYSPVQYWPADGKTVNFYSYSPSELNADETTDDNPDIPNFVNDGKVDLLYGVNIGESSKNRVVKVNFRHAMSQIKFQLKRMAATEARNAIKVNVKKVELTNIYSSGSFNFPDSTTNPDDIQTVIGRWIDLKEAGNPVIYEGDYTLTDNPVVLNSTEYMYAVPQPLIPSTVNARDYQGAFVRVLCDIYDEKTDIKIWPSTTDANYDETTGSGYVYFPLNGANAQSPAWELGKSYVYTLTVGVPDDGSGYIDFDITVDDYSEFE